MLFEVFVVLLAATTVASETCHEMNERMKEEASAYHQMDRFIPSCKADGSYEEKQCYNVFFVRCWCVDKHGVEIEGTSVNHMDLECQAHQETEPAIQTCTDKEGDIHQEGERWQTKRDPCTDCQCMNGQALCVSKMCGPPICPGGITPKLKEGTCCDFHPCPTAALTCTEEATGHVYQDGELWKPKPCTSCYCKDGKPECAEMACMPPRCQGAVLKKGTCCDFICPEEKNCTDAAGEVHPDGSTWRKDDCTKCQCLNGKPDCYSRDCRKPRPCPDGRRPVKVDGECCPKCPPRSERRFKKPCKDKVPIRGKIVLPDSGVYSHIPVGSCAYVAVQEEIMDAGADYLAEKYIAVDIMGNEIEYELLVGKDTLKMGAHYLLSATVNLGWCPTNVTSDDWIRDGDYFNDITHCLIPKAGKPNRMDIKVTPYGRSLCGAERCFSTETCTVGEDLRAFCHCPARISCSDADDWICASDGMSYPSTCHMRAADCNSAKLEKEHNGKCRHKNAFKAPESLWKGGMSVRVAMALGTAVVVTLVVVSVMLLCRKKLKVAGDDFKKTKLVNQLSVVKDGEADPIPEKVVPIPEVVVPIPEKVAEIIAAKNAPQDNINPYA